jgi:hypothetical protein
MALVLSTTHIHRIKRTAGTHGLHHPVPFRDLRDVNTETDRQTDGQTDRQTDRQTDSQPACQPDRQTLTQRRTPVYADTHRPVLQGQTKP